ncbi:pantetheine-phosphate adenylyltransferase [Mycoplasma sp. CSL7491-lung]|uniref:pantetheine-phosphate adenylyltransferase n=1 Tax=Mycoplasma sp. CSL7491-lung TaxID=549718 RepID=UPI001C11D315|nr:pantetheine-phosphate adenylyltransferase [Mycoplasma sp. CSL7491-lung]MBU4693055.1 pantetheine-phosphate adenylyltransferase [Mycoplasma sp. CSL7491-lung]
MSHKAIYAGSFNPFHKGHKSILIKAAKLFDKVYLVVAQNPDKEKNDIIKNINIIKEEIKNLEKVVVLSGKDQLIANLAKELNVKYLIRSIRNSEDLEYEFDLAAGNKILNKNLETIFILPDEKYKKYSSSLIKSLKEKEKDV